MCLAMVRFVLVMTDCRADLVEPRHDSVGLALEKERLVHAPPGHLTFEKQIGTWPDPQEKGTKNG